MPSMHHLKAHPGFHVPCSVDENMKIGSMGRIGKFLLDISCNSGVELSFHGGMVRRRPVMRCSSPIAGHGCHRL